MTKNALVLALLIAIVGAREARAQAPNECLTDGKLEACLALVHSTFDAKQWPAAWVYAQKLYDLEKTPMNALRVVIAASYAQSASVAAVNLKTWLSLKQHDAQASGDHDSSWSEIEPLGNALVAATKREEDQIAALQKENAELRTEITIKTTTVKMQVDRLDQLEKDYKTAEVQLQMLQALSAHASTTNGM